MALSFERIQPEGAIHNGTQQPSQSRFSVYSARSSIENTQQRSLGGILPSFAAFSPRVGTDTPRHGIGQRATKAFQGWRVIVLGSWLNVLLFLLPVSWILTPTMDKAHNLIFACSILSLIPLVRLHDLSTRELAIRIGGSKTGLLNASLSNIVEMVVAIIALRKCELRVVQSSLVGAMLSKLLLVLGLCFLAGGMRFSEQGFDATATQIQSSLLSISVGVVMLPAAYHFTFGSTKDPAAEVTNILHMSHGVSIVLLCIYLGYLLFQLWSHTHLYHDHHNNKSSEHPASVKISKGTTAIFRKGKGRMESLGMSLSSASDLRLAKITSSNSSVNSITPLRRPYGQVLSASASSSEVTLSNSPPNSPIEIRVPGLSTRQPSSSQYGRASTLRNPMEDFCVEETPQIDEEREQRERDILQKEPQLSWMLTIFLLVAVTIAVAVTADWLVESMDGISSTIRKEWVALILLPGVTSIAECITAVRVSVKDELTLSISVAVGSTIQTALFVIPFMVTLAWAMNKPLSLLMDPFQSLVLYISVQTMSSVVADGKSNWLEGLILVCLYIIIAISFWFYPGELPRCQQCSSYQY